jgi:hypothetical protein
MVEAANQPGDHRDPRPADTREKGEDLRHAHDASLSELERVQASIAGRSLLVRGNNGPDGGSTTHPFAGEQDAAVDDEKARGRDRSCEQDPQRMFEDKADYSGRNGSYNQEPAQPLVLGLDLAARE